MVVVPWNCVEDTWSEESHEVVREQAAWGLEQHWS